jgi:hypothetical protein
VDSGITKNYITLSIIKWLKLPYRQKLEPYTLVIILGDLVPYKDGIINLETGLVEISIKG